MKKKIRKHAFLILLFIVSLGFSQNYKGVINNIEQKGLHKIQLTSEVRSASHEDFSFLRINNSQKHEVPYVIIHNTDKTFSSFRPIEFSSKKVIKDSISSFVIENVTGKTQDHITLQIANTKIVKNYNVYGSDDGINWFGLVANKRLSYLNLPNKTTLEKTIYFPLNTYKFLRITFNDKNALPINVLGAGIYESKFFTQEPIEIKNYKQDISFLAEKKVTQIKFTAASAYKINTILFNINTEYFLRNAKIIVKKTRKIKKRVETYNQTLAHFKLNSKNKNTFDFNNLNEKEFIIEIENQDNPPLDIEHITLLQKPVYLITNLKKQKDYEIVIDTTLSKPSYDLGNFISNNTNNIEEATISNFSKIENKTIAPKSKPFWQTTTFMWVCIILGGILIIYFAIGLLKDIGNQE